MVQVCWSVGRGGGALGSYHMELYYNPASDSVMSTGKPSSGMRVDNAAVPGVLSFAGASATGFPDGSLETVVLRAKRPGVLALGLKVIEANSINRKALNPVVKLDGPLIGAPTKQACGVNSAPKIHTVTPGSAPVGRADVTRVRITGCGFDPLNSVTFGTVVVNQIASRENGTVIILAIPKETYGATESGPMRLPPGTYPLRVRNPRGISNSFDFVLR